MIFGYPQINKTIEVLKDLSRINSDRTTGYQRALYYLENLDASITDTFNVLITDGICFSQELQQMVKQYNRDIKKGNNAPGKIYRAWDDLKVEFAYHTRKAIISSSLYNEEIALHAYKAALSFDAGLNNDVVKFLGNQKEALKKNYELLKSYREVRHTASNSSLMYLV